jgi:glycosyltransferase involved in cell wall biosynthesis
MARAFPDAAVHTSLYDPAGTFPEFAEIDVRPAPLDRVAPLRRRHRWALPLLAPTFSTMRVDADVVVCSSSGWAHGARTTGRKVVYCYAPARWLYQTDSYLSSTGRVGGAGVRALLPALRTWDQRAARSADRYVSISHHTRAMVRDAYGIDSDVVFPPVTIDVSAPQSPVGDVQPGYFLCVARLLPYKNVDAVIAAFAQLRPERLVVVGDGPESARLHAMAGANVTFLSAISDDALCWLYANARAVIAASFEDFGLTPVEAAASGTPTIALRYGGYLDTVIEGSTGHFFDEPAAASIAAAVRGFATATYSSDTLRTHAASFGEEHFASQLRDVVDEAVAGAGSA